MRLEFVERYGVRAENSVVIDNLGLMPLPCAETEAAARTRRLVHISRLSRDKGSLVALQVSRSLDVPIVLAGALDAGAAADIEAEREDRHTMVSVLREVSGATKWSVLSSGRVFLFPSTYVHEAQPLVVYEAAAAGTIPVVWAAGWIREQLEALGLEHLVLPVGDVAGLAERAAELLRLSDEAFTRMSAELVERLAAAHAESERQLEAAVQRIALWPYHSGIDQDMVK
jgi:glycosyltransferase involved in cell wall biosynthesis